MGNSLLAGVTGLQAFQKMLDVAGNNLANVNTTAFKASRVSFSELLGNTIREASQPTASMGGTNPMQIGSGVQVASIDRNMTQGSLSSTGQPLDMAIDGSGYFVLNDGQRDVFTRVGTFAVDSDYNLVDPSTGARVQRIGSEGVLEGFQRAGSNDIRIPYDVALPAKATETLSYTGNLTADLVEPGQQILSSGDQFTVDSALAGTDTLLTDLDQASGLADGDTITITGSTRAGVAVNADFDIFDADGDPKTLGDLVTEMNTLFTGSTAALSNGEIVLTDNETGYSKTDVDFSFSTSGTGTLELSDYFKVISAGGEAVKNTNVEIFDAQGIGHALSASFVKSTDPNTWDLVIMSISGDVDLVSRRVNGITFNPDGSFGGLADGEVPGFQLRFGQESSNVRTVNLNFGSVGEYDGLGQLGGASTVAPSGQDGYAAGSLSSLSVNRDGVIVGVFTNGIRSNLAALRLATFQNPAGLVSTGNNYFLSSANSGDPVPVKALSGGAGSIVGGSLEKSNVDVATEFVSLIEAQNGYQANARTIKVATDMVRELTSLIR